MNFNKRQRSGVEVVDASSIDQKGDSIKNTKREFKLFMSHKISKVGLQQQEIISTEGQNKAGKSNKPLDEEEMENLKYDVELKELLNTHKLIENMQNKFGKDRLELQNKKLDQLGLANKTKTRTPRDIFYGIQEKRNKRANRQISEARDTGILTNSLEREIEERNGAYNKKIEKYKRSNVKTQDRGLESKGLKFKDGVLHVPKSKISAKKEPSSSLRIFGSSNFKSKRKSSRK
ncbi:hypothetical protein BB561_005468 [Smittium simulii]|uniref:Uncharacterized protein n=1 Tax=Smittium simulii TaxID=133385 RepID=A0A2T9YAC6_9FUNG|nr:hypothetical protein BB561_005468 [Smittium simulii]